MKPTIAVDIDNVLANTAESFAQYSNTTWGTNISEADFSEDFTRVWGVSYEEALRRMDEIYETDLFLSITPKVGAHDAVRSLKGKYDLVVLTSRRKSNAEHSLDWVETHYPGCFSEVYFSGIYDNNLADPSLLNLTKGQILQQIGASYLIDDEPKHCISAANLGIPSILFQPRMVSPSLLDTNLITTLKSWYDVRQFYHAK